MQRSILYPLIMLVAMLFAPSAAVADDTITDWEGTSATLMEGDVDSDGVAIHYHTVGEGPLIVMVHGLGGRLVGLPEPDSYPRDTLSGGGDVDTRHRQER